MVYQAHVQDEDGWCIKHMCRMRWMVYQMHVLNEADGVSDICAG